MYDFIFHLYHDNNANNNTGTWHPVFDNAINDDRICLYRPMYIPIQKRVLRVYGYQTSVLV